MKKLMLSVSFLSTGFAASAFAADRERFLKSIAQ